MLIFEQSKIGRYALPHVPVVKNECLIPKQYLREGLPGLPELSELEVVRHYTRLSHKNFGIDTTFYPLGSCTMKYNPRVAHQVASLSGLLNRHPLAPDTASQGTMECLFELQEILVELTGMQEVSLTPMAGAQGEWVGVAMIQKYHAARGDHQRKEMLVPDAAHGTNPASAAMCGCTVKVIPTTKDGDVDIDALAGMLSDKTAGIMLTNPSTLGVFERSIKRIAEMVHTAGGLLYYDGANLNAILGKVRPGDMGFDVMHMNLHKTFATPHGGGGPGAGPVAAGKRLADYLPVPMVGYDGTNYHWQDEAKRPGTIGRVGAFMGNAGILLRAYAYARLLGAEGFTRVADFATLNANYLMKALEKIGYELAFPKRSKRMIDYGYHPPTMYFPQLVPECLLIEPTETESKEILDAFIDDMKKIYQEIVDDPEMVKQAPHTTRVKRVDEVLAMKQLKLVEPLEQSL